MPSAAPADLLVRDAKLLVTMDGAEIPGGWVAISNGLVDSVGTSGSEPEARNVLSARNCLVTPGLVSVHNHMFQNLTRAFGPALNRELLAWARTGGEIWSRLDEEAAFISAWIGLAELALGGCTATSDDLYAHPRPRLIDASIRAAQEVGLRFHPCRGCVALTREQGAQFPDTMVEDEDTILADTERLIRTWHDPSPGAMVQIVCGPTASDVATDHQFRASAELAEKYDVQMTTHLLQQPGEEAWSVAKYGLRPVDWLDSVGWSTPRAWVAHSIFVNDADIRNLARWGTGVAHCPSSNCLVCNGIAPVPEMRAGGVTVGLAVDGSGTEHASMWLEARTALLLGRVRKGSTGMSARDVLEMATVGSAKCLGREGELGVLKPGACGDLVCWPQEGIYFAGALTDPVEAWIRCGPTAARHTVVAGKAIVRDGALQLPALDERLNRHTQISREWQRKWLS